MSENWPVVTIHLAAAAGTRRVFAMVDLVRGVVFLDWPGVGHVKFRLAGGVGIGDCRAWRIHPASLEAIEQAERANFRPGLDPRVPKAHFRHARKNRRK
jgi:hypothetical protein